MDNLDIFFVSFEILKMQATRLQELVKMDILLLNGNTVKGADNCNAVKLNSNC